MSGLDRFFVLKDIGQGEFGSVFLVEHRDPRMKLKYGPLAIKRVECDNLFSANEFILECLQISRLEHPNLVKYYECFIDSVESDYIALCLVMQFGGMVNLEKYLRDNLPSTSDDEKKKKQEEKPSESTTKPKENQKDEDEGEVEDEDKLLFTEEQLIDFIIQMLSGLSYLHENKFVHRDINPRNILITDNKVLTNISRTSDDGEEEGRTNKEKKDGDEEEEEDLEETFKITDFGFSKRLELEDMTGSFVGTDRYFAPEVYQNKDYSYSVDIFSLGCVLYEIMTKDRETNLGKSVSDDPGYYETVLKKKIMEEEEDENICYGVEIKKMILEMLEMESVNRPSSQRLLERFKALRRRKRELKLVEIRKKTIGRRKRRGSRIRKWMMEERVSRITKKIYQQQQEENIQKEDDEEEKKKIDVSTPVRNRMRRSVRKRVHSSPSIRLLRNPEWRKGVRMFRKNMKSKKKNKKKDLESESTTPKLKSGRRLFTNVDDEEEESDEKDDDEEEEGEDD